MKCQKMLTRALLGLYCLPQLIGSTQIDIAGGTKFPVGNERTTPEEVPSNEAIATETSTDAVTSPSDDVMRERQPRELQTKTVYSHNYIARFKFILDVLCVGTTPTVRITCLGGGTLEVLSRNHNSLTCNGNMARPGMGGSETVCYSTCSDRVDCAFFVTSYELDDNYAEIYFKCSGDHEVSSLAEIATEPTATGISCASGVSQDTYVVYDTRAFYVLQLGVFCSSLNDYWYHSGAFECAGGFTMDEKYVGGGKYSCLNGYNCGTLSCNHDGIGLVKIVHDGLEDICRQQETVPGYADPAPPASAPFVPPPGNYRMQYQARWGRIPLMTAVCSNDLPVVDVACYGGSISLINVLHPEIRCTMTDTSTIRCRETSDSARHYSGGSFSGVTFECSGSSLDEARSQATYLSGNFYCYQSVFDQVVGSVVLLGTYCGTPGLGGDFLFTDPLVECAASSWHDAEDSYFGCMQEFVIPAGAATNMFTATVGEGIIHTAPIDSREFYNTMVASKCFEADVDPAPVAAPPSFSPPANPTPSSPLGEGFPTMAPVISIASDSSDDAGNGPKSLNQSAAFSLAWNAHVAFIVTLAACLV